MKATHPVITFHTVECRADLLTQLRHERAQHEREIETGMSEAGHSALLMQAERIKDIPYRG